ncbi:MAG: FAD-binding oxidoreductase, partial [Patescibacteria group bacterium]
MPVLSHIVACKRNERIARDIYEIVFEKPAGFDFLAGQYVLFDVPHLENPGDMQTRAFSIASSPDESELLFAMKLKPGGRASRWIEERLKSGMTARMQGPFGRFILDPKLEKDILMIGTSTGVVPYRSQLLTLLPALKQRIDLIYGVRSEEDLFWADMFESLAKKYENFFMQIA